MRRDRAACPPGEQVSFAQARYISFVDELLVEVKWLICYGSAVTLAGVTAAIAARSVALWIYVGLIILTTALRFAIMRWHEKGRPSANLAVAQRYEAGYAIGVVVFMAVLSTWTLVAFWVTNDAFVRCLTFSSTIAYAFGMLARSFAINKGINAQIVVGFVPLSAATLVAGGPYPALIVLLIIPLFLSIKASSARLKQVFEGETDARAEAASLAERLDTALNNMSHGLCMFDNAGRLILANNHIPELFGLRGITIKPGASVSECLKVLVECGAVEENKLSVLASRMLPLESDSGDFVVLVDTRDGRALEITAHRMRANGSVLVVQDVTERRNAEYAIDRMARFDSVTDIPNRRNFEELLSKALSAAAKSEQTIVMFLDLDDFKQINDSLGHNFGDYVLKQIAARIESVVGKSGNVARWGGDEFVVLLRPSLMDCDIETLAGRLLKEIELPVVNGDIKIIVGASIGSAAAPRDGVSPDALLSAADMALYAAKAEGRRRWRPFERSMDTKVHIRRLIELDLRSAVANDEIDVFFQPLVDVKTGKVTSFEALARWNHPLRGRISPGEFIPVVEALGLMNDLGANILRRACSVCKTWPADITVAVNLSPSQVKDRKLMKTIEGALRDAKLDPHRLEIEITESVLLDDTGGTKEILQSLRALGIHISLDDFGTGYSSLSYLLSFPLDKIKIDRSFTIGLGVQDRSLTIVDSISSMSSRLGMSVVVEGVETNMQLDIIRRLGSIAQVQGFLFSPALPEHEIGKFFAENWGRSAA